MTFARQMPYLSASAMYTLWSFLRHLLRARRWTSFHSPQLYSLFSHCADDRVPVHGADDIEAERKRLLASRAVIRRTDHGAGSHAGRQEQEVTVGHIARHALSNSFQCRFMARMAGYTSSRQILEFGTSLGISAAYLAAGRPEGHLTTVEGDPAVATVARDVWRRLSIRTADLRLSTFDDFLASLSATETYDLIFLDGHHQADPLVRYYERLRAHIHPKTIIIVDDIYWSADMTRGWLKLAGRPEVTRSVDCFRFGLLFFDPDFKGKEHHRIRLPVAAYLS